MELTTLTALSSLDGRYFNKITELLPLMSEYALIKTRVEIEIEWLISLADEPSITEVAQLSNSQKHYLRAIYQNFSLEDALKVKQLEQTTKHDINAC